MIFQIQRIDDAAGGDRHVNRTAELAIPFPIQAPLREKIHSRMSTNYRLLRAEQNRDLAFEISIYFASMRHGGLLTNLRHTTRRVYLAVYSLLTKDGRERRKKECKATLDP